MRTASTRAHRRTALTAALLTTLAVIPLIAAPVAARQPSGAAYWTSERLANAKPRDFIRTADGTYEQAKARPERGKPGTGTGNVTGASWTLGGRIDSASGKVWFTMDGSDWVCSAAVVDDADANRSLVITAAHCAYDEVEEAFATNWTFIPDFDANPTYTCTQNLYGCWEAEALVVHDGYASAGGFNDEAVKHDFAVAVVGGGTRNGGQLDAIGGTGTNDFQIAYNATYGTNPLYSFGYPASGKYKGRDLVYCKGPLGTDPQVQNATWSMPCNMTGGSSGGPWLSGFSESTGIGTLGSLNSYGYSGSAVMYGPKFNDDTQLVVNTARTTPFGTDRIVQ